MTTQSNAFTAVGGGTSILIKRGNSITYTLTGGATATLNIERSANAGVSWEIIETVTANTGPTTVKNNGNSDAIYRWNCTAYTSGTATGTIKDATEELLGAGSPSVSTITAYEYGDGIARKTVLECNGLIVTISDDAGVAQYGGVKAYDFPEGMLLLKGARVGGTLTAGTTGTIIDNWDGDVALGTVTATTGATLTGTEADLMPSVAVSAGASDKDGVVSAVSVATALTESGARWLDGTSTAKDMFLNFVIDDDATHTAGTATFNGTIEFNWEMMGDN
jgi:hypothetical protein